jgi:hypothetical protein
MSDQIEYLYYFFVGDVHGDFGGLSDLYEFCADNLKELFGTQAEYDLFLNSGGEFERAVVVGDYGWFPGYLVYEGNFPPRLAYVSNSRFKPSGFPAKNFSWIDGNHEDHEAIFNPFKEMEGVAEREGYIPRFHQENGIMFVGGARSIFLDKFQRLMRIVPLMYEVCQRDKLIASKLRESFNDIYKFLDSTWDFKNLPNGQGKLIKDFHEHLLDLILEGKVSSWYKKSTLSFTITDLVNRIFSLYYLKAVEGVGVNAGEENSEVSDHVITEYLDFACLFTGQRNVFSRFEELTFTEYFTQGFTDLSHLKTIIAHQAPAQLDCSAIGNPRVVMAGENKKEETRLVLGRVVEESPNLENYIFGHWHNSREWNGSNLPLGPNNTKVKKVKLLDQIGKIGTLNKIKHVLPYISILKIKKVNGIVESHDLI